MSEFWKKYAARIDALVLRERVLVFSTIILAIAAGMNSLLIEPEFAAERRNALQVVERQAELATLQVQVQKLLSDNQEDPNIALRAELEANRVELERLDETIAVEKNRFTSSEQVKAVLHEVLARNRDVKLLELRTLPVTTIADSTSAAAGTSQAKSPPSAEHFIYRHGVEIALSGTYFDLLKYLQQIEKVPATLFWGKLTLNVEEHPAITLRLTLYTLSLDRAWMIV